jgi:hypothetical protein
MIQTPAQLLTIGFRVLLTGHKLGDVMQADLTARQERDERAGEAIGEGQIKLAQPLRQALGRIGRIGVGHSGAFAKCGNSTIDPEWPVNHLMATRRPYS